MQISPNAVLEQGRRIQLLAELVPAGAPVSADDCGSALAAEAVSDFVAALSVAAVEDMA